MTHPAERRLARIATDIAWLQARVPLALTALETVAATGYPTSSSGTTSGGDTARPTETAATDHARQKAERLDARTAELAGLVTEFVDDLKRMPASIDPRLKHNAAAEALRARCSGGEGDWADPHCPNLEIRTIESDDIQGVRIGVCWSCITRRRRWYERNDQQATG